MRSTLTVLIVAGLLATTGLLHAADAPAKVIPASEAKNHIDEVATVTGTVSSMKTTKAGLILMNLDGAYPDQELTVLVKPEHTKEVGDLDAFENKKIVVHGKIISFHEKPEIEITAKDQIELAK